MRIEYETNLQERYLHVYLPGSYEEDYQLPMLGQNRIRGVLPVTGCAAEGEQRYTYTVSGHCSLCAYQKKTTFGKKDMERLVTDLWTVSGELKNYMLDPNKLWLHPEYIFRKEGRWFFCYLPGKVRDIRKQFHELTEYFVKVLDYEDEQAIRFAYELHKATLQEAYDLGEILKKKKGKQPPVRKQHKQAPTQEVLPPPEIGSLFQLSEEESDGREQYRNPRLAPVLQEEKTFFRWGKRRRERSKKSRWGDWEDLLMESETDSAGVFLPAKAGKR